MEEIDMARVVNYEQKIQDIKAKIEKKSEELKNLKADLAKLEDAKTKRDFHAARVLVIEKKLEKLEADESWANGK
jgi:uncharacterized protein (DUF342 family)